MFFLLQDELVDVCDCNTDCTVEIAHDIGCFVRCEKHDGVGGGLTTGNIHSGAE